MPGWSCAVLGCFCAELLLCGVGDGLCWVGAVLRCAEFVLLCWVDFRSVWSSWSCAVLCWCCHCAGAVLCWCCAVLCWCCAVLVLCCAGAVLCSVVLLCCARLCCAVLGCAVLGWCCSDRYALVPCLLVLGWRCPGLTLCCCAYRHSTAVLGWYRCVLCRVGTGSYSCVVLCRCVRAVAP